MNKREIKNQTFNQAYQNLDNLKIMSSAITSSGTTCILTIEELESCKLIALWKTLQSWSEEDFPNVKFTTFLFKHVRWQCYFQAHIITKYNKHHRPMVDYSECFYLPNKKEDKYSFSMEDKLAIDEALNQVSEKELDIIEQRFYQQMTLKEIGKANGYSHETARVHVGKAVNSIKKLYM